MALASAFQSTEQLHRAIHTTTLKYQHMYSFHRQEKLYQQISEGDSEVEQNSILEGGEGSRDGGGGCQKKS